MLRPEDLQGCLWSDGELTLAELTLETAELLRESGPWGQGFPEPLFDGIFTVRKHRILKEQHVKLWLQPMEAGQPLEAIAFQWAERFSPNVPQWRAAYRLDVNEWRAERRLQLRIKHLEPVG